MKLATPRAKLLENQAGAIVVHARRKETKALPMNVVLLLLAAFVAAGRFAG
ncbi:hypothetical protein ACFVYA_47890 [Amycolatopsis sp. NPDC058278]|uniref:hypothetical protein n=1 Tax=Amycolatopsis sp. NPDC058278 TaxID=3346417 RepID=UPI0036DAF19B